MKFLDFNPKINFKKHSFSLVTCLEVPCSYDFKGKGLLRTFGGILRDTLRFDIYRLYRRTTVLLNLVKDPLDNYYEWINMNKKNDIDTKVFFLISDFSRYDRNLSFYSKLFKEKIKDVADFCEVSLLSSFLSINNKKIIKNERKTKSFILKKLCAKILGDKTRKKTPKMLIETENLKLAIL